MNIHIKNIMNVVPMTEKDYVLEDVNIYIKDKNIFHIGDELKDFNFDKAELLHPTPAICGFPVNKARTCLYSSEWWA